MNILVVSKVSIPAKDRTLPAWEHLRALGHTVTVDHPDAVRATPTDWPQAMICMGVTCMAEAFEALQHFPGVPLYVFNWDCYSWIWEPGQEGKKQAYHPMRGAEYDYGRFGDLCRQAKEVWVPSRCTGEQAEMWWGVKNWHVILSSCPWWDAADIKCEKCGGEGRLHDGYDGIGTLMVSCPDCCNGFVSGVKDGGYALCTLRHLPDAWDTVFEECCEELKIPYLRTDHNLSRPDYEKAVAECRFLCCHYQEASTGGLTLMEGYRLGKPVLLSDSQWNGGSDYFGDRAWYFRHDDKDSFKNSLSALASGPATVHADHKQYIEDNFNDTLMVTRMMERMQR